MSESTLCKMTVCTPIEHAVWSPPWLEGYLFGGASSQNTDGEWGDLRAPRWVSTYADDYEATGSIEYLERAVALRRASFANMDIQENYANRINTFNTLGGPGLGHASETICHDRASPNWCRTGFNWGPGGALAASAYLERRFGSVWVDGQARQVIPTDGVNADIMPGDTNGIALGVHSVLPALGYDDKGRQIRVNFGRLPKEQYTVTINGVALGRRARAELQAGLSIKLP